MKKKLPLLLLLPAFSLLNPLPASANTLFILDRDGCTGSCGTAPFGSITISQPSAFSLTVTEVLTGPEVFGGTGAGSALAFNLPGPFMISNLSSGFAMGNSPAQASAFGTFLYSIVCTDWQGGKLTNPAGPLSFTIAAEASLTAADFVANDRGYSFASDIRGTGGKTGNVAALAGIIFPVVESEVAAVVPEPASMLLIGGALMGLSLYGRRRLARREPPSKG